MGLLNDCPPVTAYYHISKGLFITVPFTQYIMSSCKKKQTNKQTARHTQTQSNIIWDSKHQNQTWQGYWNYQIGNIKQSKAMLKILHARLQRYVNWKLQMFKLDLENAEEQEIKLPTSVGSSRKQESSRKASTSALLTKPKALIVWMRANCKILKEMGIPDYLTCLLRNLYAHQEAS